jgi:peptidyl-tRNA hydrolase
MEFEPALVDDALTKASDLESAIAWIISALEEADLQANQEAVSLWLLVRMDLKMGMGKVAAQCAHAALKAFLQGRQRAQSDDGFSVDFISWLERGQSQTVVKVESEQQLFELLESCRKDGASTCYIRDAGRTQVAHVRGRSQQDRRPWGQWDPPTTPESGRSYDNSVHSDPSMIVLLMKGEV